MAPQTRSWKKAVAAAAPVIDPADRISNLPKDIQAQILSFLPAEEAVRTCVLARTWRHVWKSTRLLLITDNYGVSVQEVRGFVDRLLRLRLDGLKDHEPIDACKIVFDEGYGTHNNDGTDDDIEIMPAVESWIRRLLECPVQSLRVHMIRDDGFYAPYYIDMTNIDQVLVSRHLTSLVLYGLRFFNGTSICVVTATGCLNFSGCPALEQLKVIDCYLFGIRKVTSPSVKRLVITYCETGQTSRLEICFPRLVSLWLEGFYDATPVLESMPQLAVAYVSIYSDDDFAYGKDDYATKCLVLEG